MLNHLEDKARAAGHLLQPQRFRLLDLSQMYA